jgi:hypothetical protein
MRRPIDVVWNVAELGQKAGILSGQPRFLLRHASVCNPLFLARSTVPLCNHLPSTRIARVEADAQDTISNIHFAKE